MKNLGRQTWVALLAFALALLSVIGASSTFAGDIQAMSSEELSKFMKEHRGSALTDDAETIPFEQLQPLLAQQNEFVPKLEAFRDIQAVGIWVTVPAPYEHSVECHDREEECADENGGLNIYPERRKEYIDGLKDMYANYPLPLRKKSLENLFREKAERALSPFIVSENKVPVILDYDNVYQFVEMEGNVTLAVDLRIVNHLSPNIAVLSWGFYRPDNADFKSAIKLRHFSAYPLNMSEERIQKEIESTMKSFRIPIEERSRKVTR